MGKVDFTLKDGRVRKIGMAVAVVLAKRGRGTYQTRDMARQPMVAPMLKPEPAGDGYDAMTREQLFALAEERGIKVHGASGADKVRAALRSAGA